jgi:Ca2+-binding RTX toxin-like protein
MTSFTVNGEVTAPQVLNLDEAGAVTTIGNLMVTSQNSAVTMTAFAFLNVSGSIYSAVNGVDAQEEGYVIVGTTGILTGFTYGVHIAGGAFQSTVNNLGVVYGSGGIFADSGSLLVLNAGQITGDFTAGVRLAGTGALQVTNSGDIFGAVNGIESVGTSSATITNTGVISGGIAALSLSSGASLVTNTGTLGGKSLLGGGADTFNGTGGTQGNVYGGTGADIVLGGDGDDKFFGDAGADILRGRLGDDALDGGADADQLFGGLGDDSLTGGTGLDTLRGGADDDRLTGGTGVDTFVFLRNQGTDRITDFVNNVDKLDLRAFDFASVAAVAALASASSFGLRIDVPGEGVVFVAGLTLATLNGADLLL